MTQTKTTPFLEDVILKISPQLLSQKITLNYNYFVDPISYEFFFDDVIKLGNVFFNFDVVENHLFWLQFYPLSTAEAKSLHKGNLYNPHKKSYKLGTLAHVLSLYGILQDIPELFQGSISHPGIPSSGRIAHLAAMGIDYEKIYSFKDYFSKSLEYVNSKGFIFPEKPF
ncbi:hypothetical protein K9M74_00455 [Candidatus Woesearchaeota archaeon]|nr:hypothetical protein [Candidatus Woesearchaeota archaeon]